MRVIVTGGTGLIGKPLVAELAKSYEVVVLSRSPEKHSSSMPSGVKMVKWDGMTTAGWGELVDGAYGIINLAGAGIADARWSKARKELIIDSRVNAGRAVVDAVRDAAVKPKVVLQSSAIGFYGDRGDEILTERSSAGSDFTAEVCIPWEQSTAEVAEMGVRHVIMRTGIVLSMRGGALPRLMLPINLAGGKLGDGTQWMSWIHIGDEVAAICALLADAESEGIYNLTAPNPLQNRRVVQKIAMVMGKLALFPAPAFAIKAALGEMSDVVLKGQRVIPERLVKQGYSFRFTDIETALRDIIPT